MSKIKVLIKVLTTGAASPAAPPSAMAPPRSAAMWWYVDDRVRVRAGVAAALAEQSNPVASRKEKGISPGNQHGQGPLDPFAEFNGFRGN